MLKIEDITIPEDKYTRLTIVDKKGKALLLIDGALVGEVESYTDTLNWLLSVYAVNTAHVAMTNDGIFFSCWVKDKKINNIVVYDRALNEEEMQALYKEKFTLEEAIDNITEEEIYTIADEIDDFDAWWWNEGSGIKPTEEEIFEGDMETFAKRVAQIAWNNGAYKAGEKHVQHKYKATATFTAPPKEEKKSYKIMITPMKSNDDKETADV